MMNNMLDWDHFREDARIHDDSDSPIEYCHLSEMDFKLPDLSMEMGDVRSFLDNIDKGAIAVY